MAAPKKRAVKKPRALRTVDLASATSSSVKAVLKKSQLAIGGGGTTVGILIDKAHLEARSLKATEIAKQIAAGVSEATGVRLTAATASIGDGILVGFAPPRSILKALG